VKLTLKNYTKKKVIKEAKLWQIVGFQNVNKQNHILRKRSPLVQIYEFIVRYLK
jgi:hypothetical protein